MCLQLCSEQVATYQTRSVIALIMCPGWPGQVRHVCKQACSGCWLQVVELKGNIRVLARIRPHNDTEKARAGADTVESAVRTVNEETIMLAGNVTKEFEFDRVFGPSDGQQQVGRWISR